ncbi:Endonuclease MutS2 [bioreactor metagenome]|uniref:Endonuclease MutS2 n=1 Tax=bioreactor metagenome TaxID=1076179 RepID=A0A644VJ44_9ZZZZ|nr:endonuclease MutS2 [Negativicutes bacterium]
MDLSVLRTLEYHKVQGMLAHRTSSVIGRELVEQLTPISNYAEVQLRIQETEEARQILDEYPNVPLGGIRDIREMVRRAQLNAILEPDEILAIGSTLYAARRLKTFFNNLPLHIPLLTALVTQITVIPHIESLIENTINEHGIVRDDASTELTRIRREIRVSQARVKEKLDSILRSSEYQKLFQDTLVTIRGDRYVIPIKQEYRTSFPGIIHDQSASGATVFIEPMAIVNLNNDIKQLMSADKTEVERILRMVSGKVGEAALTLQTNCNVLAQLDFSCAKAKLSIDMRATKPLLNDNGIVELHQARHPLIDSDVVVPIDIHLGKNFNILIITGPNTGGKTVSLKTLGLFAMMVQAGLYIPAASESKMTIFQNIFADIGDEQSIEQSLSTFSGHMTNLVKILSKVSGNDLVLIDEIGAGTDPQEGAALAMSILEYLLRINSRVIVTTHYSELKTFAYSRHGIENASVEFDIQTLRPTYRLLLGVPGGSNAFAISQRLGLVESIIIRAQELLSKEHTEMETVLNTLEEKKRAYVQLYEQISQGKQQLLSDQQDLSLEKKRIEETKNSIMAKARDAAALVLRNARREATDIIDELKAQFSVHEAKNRQQAIDKARQRLKNSLDNVDTDDEITINIISKGMLKPGLSVYVTTLRQKGTILAVGDKEVSVQIGILKVNVPLSVCVIREEDKPNNTKTYKPTDNSNRQLTSIKHISREIDIRGTTVEEAEVILDKFIDDAVLSNLTEFIVIHGKGTGALRKGVRAYLKSHRSVRDISIGEVNEGGDGATVVKLI